MTVVVVDLFLLTSNSFPRATLEPEETTANDWPAFS